MSHTISEESLSYFSKNFDVWMVKESRPIGINDGDYLFEWCIDTPGVMDVFNTYDCFCSLARHVVEKKGYQIPVVPSQIDFDTGATIRLLAKTFDCWLTEINGLPKETVTAPDGGDFLLQWLKEDFGVKRKVKSYERFADMIDFLEQNMDYKFGSRPSEDIFYGVPDMVRPKPVGPSPLDKITEASEEPATEHMTAASIPAASQEVLAPRKRGRRPRINPVLAELPLGGPVEGIARAFNDWARSADTFLYWIMLADGVKGRIDTYPRFQLTARFLIENMGYKFPIPTESQYNDAMKARARRTVCPDPGIAQDQCVL